MVGFGGKELHCVGSRGDTMHHFVRVGVGGSKAGRIGDNASASHSRIISHMHMHKMLTGWPRFDSLRFRFVPAWFKSGSVRERFVFDQFGSFRFMGQCCSVRFGCSAARCCSSLFLKAVHRISLRLAAAHPTTHNQTFWL